MLGLKVRHIFFLRQLPPGIYASLSGFDEEGAQQLKHRLKGTGKWIGTGGTMSPY